MDQNGLLYIMWSIRWFCNMQLSPYKDIEMEWYLKTDKYCKRWKALHLEKNIIVLMSDFNAQVREIEEIEIARRDKLDKCNDEGDRLKEFCKNKCCKTKISIVKHLLQAPSVKYIIGCKYLNQINYLTANRIQGPKKFEKE